MENIEPLQLRKDWTHNKMFKKIPVGDNFIVHYLPIKDNNFDLGCVYVFHKKLFTIKCLALDTIIDIGGDKHKQAERIIERFKKEYNVTVILKIQ